MKFKSILCTIMALIVAFSYSSFSADSSYKNNDVSNTEKTVDMSKVLEARFINMLNHNYAYDDDFSTVKGLVDCSTVALLNKAEDSYIPELFVKEYIANMYGVYVENFEDTDCDISDRQGYIYILPRGFATYSHKAESVSENPDGTYTVVSTVEINCHDGEVYLQTAETLFVKNPKSEFGFNIVHSNLIENVSSI